MNLNEEGVNEAKSSVGMATVKLRWGADSEPEAPRGVFGGDGSVGGTWWSFRGRYL